MLLKAACTRVAASLIEGKITHVICGISAAVRRFDANDDNDDTYETRAKLEKFWEEFLALDENRCWPKIFLLFRRETQALWEM